MALNNCGAYWISSMITGAGQVCKNKAGSSTASRRISRSSSVTYARDLSAHISSKVVLPTCLGPVTRSTGKLSLTRRTVWLRVRGYIKILNYWIHIPIIQDFSAARPAAPARQSGAFTSSKLVVMSAVLPSMMVAEQYLSWLMAMARSTVPAFKPLPVTTKCM